VSTRMRQIWLVLVTAVAATAVATVDAVADETLVGVVPVVDRAHFVPAPWMLQFADYAERYWAQTSQGQLDLVFHTMPPQTRRASQRERLSAFDRTAVGTWVDRLARLREHVDPPPDLWLLLFPRRSLVGAGFYLPQDWVLAEYGLSTVPILGADRPQAALHEIGHWLGVPDRDQPHSTTGATVLTLMGRTGEPAAPLDAVARTDRGWATVRRIDADQEPSITASVLPTDVLLLAVGRQELFIGLQPLRGLEHPVGWLIEVDRRAPDLPFQRMFDRLLGPREPDTGRTAMLVDGRQVVFQWQFVPEPPRLLVDVEVAPASPAASAAPVGSRPVPVKLLWGGAGMGAGLMVVLLWWAYRRRATAMR